MVQNIVPLKDIDLTSKDFTIQVMVIEKEIAKPTSKKSIPCQRFMLQDIEVCLHSIHIYIFKHICSNISCFIGSQNPGCSAWKQCVRAGGYIEIVFLIFNHESNC